MSILRVVLHCNTEFSNTLQIKNSVIVLDVRRSVEATTPATYVNASSTSIAPKASVSDETSEPESDESWIHGVGYLCPECKQRNITYDNLNRDTYYYYAYYYCF